MKFCKYCGNSIDENAIFCPNCGARVSGDGPRTNTGAFGGYDPYGYSAPAYDMQGSMLVTIISFLFWEVGLIIWFFWRMSRPGKARSAAKGALANVCLGMPVLGAALWLVWKDDIGKRDYAKVCGISAIVGVGIYVFMIAALVVLYATGAMDAGYYTDIPFGDLSAAAFSLFG